MSNILGCLYSLSGALYCVLGLCGVCRGCLPTRMRSSGFSNIKRQVKTRTHYPLCVYAHTHMHMCIAFCSYYYCTLPPCVATRLHYLKGWFLLDFFSSVPLDLILNVNPRPHPYYWIRGGGPPAEGPRGGRAPAEGPGGGGEGGDPQNGFPYE